MDDQKRPLYKSSPTKKSLGNEYRIYPEKLELNCRFPFFPKTFTIKKQDLVSIDLFQPPVIRTTFRALKLDLADLYQHVGIKRKNGLFKQLRFTPENPEEFVKTAKRTFHI